MILRWLEEKVPAWVGVPVRGALLPVGTVAVKAAISNTFGIRHGGSEPISRFSTKALSLNLLTSMWLGFQPATV